MVDKRVRGPYKQAGEKGHNRPGSGNVRFDAARQKLYVEELARTGLTVCAREAANVCPLTVKRKLAEDPEFAEACEQAMQRHNSVVERKIYELGVEGFKRAVYWNGEIVGYEIHHDSKLLLAYARRRMKEYRESFSVDQRTEHAGSVAVGLADLGNLSRESRELLRKLLEKEESVEQQPAGESEERLDPEEGT